jgi:spore coat protein H
MGQCCVRWAGVVRLKGGYGMGLFVRIILVALVLSPCALAQNGGEAKKGSASDEFFGFPTLHRFHLIISHEGWEAMQPYRDRDRDRGGRRRGWLSELGLSAGEEKEAAAAEKAVLLDVHEHHMGRPFRYVRAVLEHGGRRHGEVGVRFKGNSSYVASEGSYKRPMKVDFDRVEGGREFFDLDGVNFNNNAIDPSLLREHLSYALFREAGVPAPRTALAAVTLSVEPLVKEKRLGAYVIVEDVDKKFVRSRFGSVEGLLIKPEGTGAFGNTADDLKEAYGNYSAKWEPSPEVGKRFLEFLRLLNGADDATFAREIESYVEMEEFLRFLAVNVLLANYDSFLAMGHNFYAYLNPRTLKLHFIPWDLNLSFGGYVRVPPGEVARCSVDRPWIGRHRLVERVLKVEKYRERYRAILGELNGTLFEPEKLIARVERLEELLREVRDLPKEPSNPSVARGALSEAPELKQFIRDRHVSVKAQLAGDLSGAVVPRFTHGPITGYLKRAGR